MNENILSIKGATKYFGGLIAVRDVGFDVQKGEVVGLMGPNGAGKTTLLNLIAGEYIPDSGSITYKERDISGLSPHKICHLGIARTYQIPQPFVTLTVRENLMVSSAFGRRMKRGAAEKENDRICDLANLAERKDTIAGKLPVLLLKKLELARALACKPELLLLDEVAAGTTEAEIPRILSIMREIRDMGITIIIIEHVMKVLVGLADRIVVIDKGIKIAEGSPAEVMDNKKVMEAYFGT
jgi:branched-chain amino acid transport system ATP-binding protein